MSGKLCLTHTQAPTINAGLAPSPEDVAWASALLGRLSDKQWADAFRAGGYEPEVANRFIAKLKTAPAAIKPTSTLSSTTIAHQRIRSPRGRGGFRGASAAACVESIKG